MRLVPKRQDELTLDEADYRNQVFADKHLVIVTRGYVRLGPKFLAKRCDVDIASGTELIVAGADFDECTINCKSTSGGHSQYATFSNCTFLGEYGSWKFGGRTGKPPVKNCDFSGANLHDVRFFDTDMSEQRFRGWPTVVFREPMANKDRLRAMGLPGGGKAQIWLQALWMESCSGVAVDARRVCRAIGVTRGRFRELAEALGELVIV